MSVAHTRNFNKLAVAVVVAALVLAASLISYSHFEMTVTSTVTATSTASVVTSVSSYCNEGVYNSLTDLTLSNVPVLLMQPDTTGYICVTYQSSWAGNASIYTSQFFPNGTYQFQPLSISREHCVTTGTATQCNPTISNSFQTSTSPAVITPSPTTDYVSVVFTVTALANSTGFYDRSAPYDYCIGMPVAVGYSALQVNSSDFSPIIIPPCAFMPFAPVGVSVGEMNVIYIPFSS